MTGAEARQLAWDIGGDLAGLLGLVAVILLGLALLSEVNR